MRISKLYIFLRELHLVLCIVKQESTLSARLAASRSRAEAAVREVVAAPFEAAAAAEEWLREEEEQE